MRVPYRWLSELVDIPWSAEELADRLTLNGLEVGSIIDHNGGAEGVIAARVTSVTNNPSLERLVVCEMDAGDDHYRVLTGWDGVRVGQLLAFAPPGAVLPGGKRIEAAVFSAEISEGMLCSATEMLLGEAHREGEGVLVLPEDIEPGTDLSEHYGLKDKVLELDLTPNYSHCLSMIGVASEVAAVTGGQVRLPVAHVEESGLDAKDAITIRIEAPDLCPRYAARMIRDVRLDHSPVWLQARLIAAGMRPINNVVDITNYVMLTLGQPLHAFDYRQIAERQIIVRRAGKDRHFTTLDGVERHLSEDSLVIADGDRAVAIAGVMGGLNSEIEADTREVLIESALFDPVSVRRTGTALALRSEASQRFERGIDPQVQAYAADLAASMMCSVAGGVADRGIVDEDHTNFSPTEIVLRKQHVRDLLGVDISDRDIALSLQRLGFVVDEADSSAFSVVVPSKRVDVALEVDLIEEVGRIYGYDKIPSRLLEKGSIGINTDYQTARRSVLESMTGLGLQQVVTFSFISPKDFEKTRVGEVSENRALTLKNPMVYEQSVMRQSVLPGLLSAVSYNVSHQNKDFGMFDLGKVFLPSGEKLPLEPHHLGMVAIGVPGGRSWERSGAAADFFYAKGLLETLFAKFGAVIREPFFEASSHPTFHPWRQAQVSVRFGDTRHVLGHVGEIHPDVAEAYGVEGRVAAFEIDCEPLFAGYPGYREIRPIPRFPSITRDIALVVPDNVPAVDVERLLRSLGGHLLESVLLFDLYRGAPVEEGARSLAFTMVYRSFDHTLTDAEVDAHHENLRRIATKQLGAMLR